MGYQAGKVTNFLYFCAQTKIPGARKVMKVTVMVKMKVIVQERGAVKPIAREDSSTVIAIWTIVDDTWNG